MNLAEKVLRESNIQNESAYLARVRGLAAVYFALFSASLLGLAVILSHLKLFITLAQRSNVETLTLAFLLLLFCYLAALSIRGAWGALRLLRFRLIALFRGEDLAERAKQDSFRKKVRGDPPSIAVSVAIERKDRPGEPIRIQVQDEIGSVGTVHIDGARVEHREALCEGSYNPLAYAVNQIATTVSRRGDSDALIDIVEWQALDDEEHAKYLAQVEFASRLSRQLQAAEPLWKTVTLSNAELLELESNFGKLCPAVRERCLLPLWEYAADHKLPIIPEPLGIISLSRSEKRVDPMASMGAALVVVVLAVALCFVIVFSPPWVPGT